MTSTNDRAPDPRPARTRSAIFAAARDLTAADGEVTVNALAKQAGVSRAAFYSHFSGLDALMGAMLEQMFEKAWERGAKYGSVGTGLKERICFGFGMLVAYVERHHAFLRGALEWKFAHRTFMVMIEMMTELHAIALDRLGDDLPAGIEIRSMGRSIAGGAVAQCCQWLVDTEEEAHAGGTPDATELLRSILRNAPTWYTGLEPGKEFGVVELLENCRQIKADEEA